MEKTLTEQTGDIEVRSPEEIKKIYPFVLLKEEKNIYSGWHSNYVDYMYYGFKKDNKEFWFQRRTSNKDIGTSYEYSDILVILKSLVDSKFKYALNHCGKGCLGTANKFISPLEFIKWIKENKYNFNHFFDLSKVKNGQWVFSGNLIEYSSAFQFDIFDKGLYDKIKEECSSIKVIAD